MGLGKPDLPLEDMQLMVILSFKKVEIIITHEMSLGGGNQLPTLLLLWSNAQYQLSLQGFCV